MLRFTSSLFSFVWLAIGGLSIGAGLLIAQLKVSVSVLPRLSVVVMVTKGGFVWLASLSMVPVIVPLGVMLKPLGRSVAA